MCICSPNLIAELSFYLDKHLAIFVCTLKYECWLTHLVLLPGMFCGNITNNLNILGCKTFLV